MTSDIHSRTRGLTLVELLVTVTLTTVMIAGVYMIYNKSVLAFRVESQVMTMQDRLRFGLEHLKRDVRRAGFLATPNSDVDTNLCPTPASALRAVTITAAHGDVAESDVNANISPSSITLFGDFFSGQVYRTSGIIGNEVYFDTTDAVNFPRNELEFERIFCGLTCTDPNRYLRIVTRDQFEVLIEIGNATWLGPAGQPMIELVSDVPRVGGGNLCGITGLGEGLEANVAGFIRYRIAFDTRPNAPLGAGGAGDYLKTDLIREELNVTGTVGMSGTALVVADYAVDLQFFDFGFDISGADALPTVNYVSLVTEVLSGTDVGVLDNSAAATPETLRVLTLKLTLRADDEDPSHPFSPRAAAFDPVDGYEIYPNLQGSCRTLSLACKVGLSSLLARNLNPGGL